MLPPALTQHPFPFRYLQMLTVSTVQNPLARSWLHVLNTSHAFDSRDTQIYSLDCEKHTTKHEYWKSRHQKASARSVCQTFQCKLGQVGRWGLCKWIGSKSAVLGRVAWVQVRSLRYYWWMRKHPCRVIERILLRGILTYLDENHILAVEQHGFQKGHSTLTNLSISHDHWTRSFDSGISVDIIFFDFSKAFDSVVHAKLLAKLRDIHL